MQQPGLAGFDPAPPSLHRLFFALWPGDGLRRGIADAAERLQREHGGAGRRIGPHRYHLTLQFLGDFAQLPPTLVEQAAGAAATAAGRAPAFDLVLDRAGSFRNRSIPWWIGCEALPPGLEHLWNGLGDALARAGARAVASGRALVPHVTVVRDASRPLPPVAIDPLPWRVDSFVLIHSELGARNAYTEVGRWPLAG
jgi:2'-5' RNA ligase